MPPGRGYYGKQFKTQSERRLTPFYLLAAVPVLAVFAWVGSMVLGGSGGGEDFEQANPDGAT
ncbi:MAG TPA: hypothetical protein PJ994_09680, partial [Tepidiformaceae bacterium]|nr:hypothetical protein [Tepidiformaceae bacterium]